MFVCVLILFFVIVIVIVFVPKLALEAGVQVSQRSDRWEELWLSSGVSFTAWAVADGI